MLSLPKIHTGGFNFGARQALTKPPEDWPEWIPALFPQYAFHAPGEHHAKLWDWTWKLEPGIRSHPLVEILARGGAKSTSAEMATVAVGARGARKYGLYISATQDQADDHVQTIADMIEGSSVERYYPDMAAPLVGKHGNSKGWRRNRLRCANGFTVDAYGLDNRSARGAKLEEHRPDFLVLDDVDAEHDTTETIQKKIKTITRKLLPAGSEDLAVLAVQNLVHSGSVFDQLANGEARFLMDREVVGPIPALYDALYDEDREEIVAGYPSWQGQSLERCRAMARDMGLEAFRIECQHEVDILDETAFKKEWFAANRYDPLERKIFNRSIARWEMWDTAAKDEPHHARTAMIVGDLMPDYRLLIRYAYADRLTFDLLPDRIIEESAPFVRDKKLRAVGIEDASSGTQALQVLSRTAPPWLRSKLLAMPATRAKEQEWGAAALWCRRGCVQLPEPDEAVPWLGVVEHELFSPRPDTLDLRDAFAKLINHVENATGAFSIRWRKVA